MVIATGACDVPHVPQVAAGLGPSVAQVVPSRYRRPADLAPGGVLVVGASATGVQLADELHRSGRPVTLAVGRHLRLPRRYRGRDILWWLDRMGVLDERADAVSHLEASREQPSMQLVGRDDHASLDLAALRAAGVRLVGRLAGLDGSRAAFSGDLERTTRAADAKLARLLDRVDGFVAARGLGRSAPEEARPAPVRATPAPERLDLRAEGIRTVVWATGYRRSYPWLHVPVLDARGEVRHRGGVTPAPGLYVLGLRFLRRRKSTFIDGVGDDARELAAHLAWRLSGERRTAA